MREWPWKREGKGQVMVKGSKNNNPIAVHVSMIVRNEAERHLGRALRCAWTIAESTGGMVHVTDDASEDDTATMCLNHGAKVRQLQEPTWLEHEGAAREAHYRWAEADYAPGDWVLALDADETINLPEEVGEVVAQAVSQGCGSVGLPLYEFWTDTHYRVDGLWFGARTPRLYAWQPSDGAAIRQRPMGCGSEPLYAASAAALRQDRLHLLHWGYVRESDRHLKYSRYTSRAGGHGHLNAHVQSILAPPMLKRYDKAV